MAHEYQTSILLRSELKKAALKQAKQEKISLAELVRRALKRYLGIIENKAKK